MTEDDAKPLWGPTEFARQLAFSILNCREEWTTEERRVWFHHQSRVSVWIANEADGLGISVGDNRRAEPRDGQLRHVDKQCIWRAVKAVTRDRERLRRRRAAEAFHRLGAVQ